ncbi:MAG: TetR/AcrR family transcriptional regulator, partial [Clostridiales bacterium]|nr:TetR/AcrR family transcriptional regulator [Clostridiales bacterium]
MAAPRKENVKYIIIEATQELLLQKGISDISLAEIAKKAGISKGTLYYHYKSKDEILFDIMDKYLQEQWQNLIDWTEDENKDTSLHRLVRYVVERNIA